MAKQFDPARAFAPPQPLGGEGIGAATQAQAASASALASIYANARRQPQQTYDPSGNYAQMGAALGSSIESGVQMARRARERREDRAFAVEQQESQREYEISREKDRQAYEERISMATQRLGNAQAQISGEFEARVARANDALTSLDQLRTRLAAGDLENLPYATLEPGTEGPEQAGRLPWTKAQVEQLIAAAPEMQGRILDELLDGLASGKEAALAGAQAEMRGQSPTPVGDIRINSETASRLFQQIQTLNLATLAHDNKQALNEKQKGQLLQAGQINTERWVNDVKQEAEGIRLMMAGTKDNLAPAKAYGRKGAFSLLKQITAEAAGAATKMPPVPSLLQNILPAHMQQGELGQATLAFLQDPNNPELRQSLSAGHRVGIYEGISDVARQVYAELESIETPEQLKDLTGYRVSPKQFAEIKEQATMAVTTTQALARNALINQSWGAKMVVDNPAMAAEGLYGAITRQLQKQGVDPSPENMANLIQSGKALDMLFQDFAENSEAAAIARGQALPIGPELPPGGIPAPVRSSYSETVPHPGTFAGARGY